MWKEVLRKMLGTRWSKSNRFGPFALFLIPFFLLTFNCNHEVPNATRLPNFIIIFTDDLGYGDLSCFGHPTIQTPHLDQMAQEGMKLTQFYVAASICTPSRAGLLTGRLPIRNGMCGKRGVLFPDSAGGLPTDETTIAEALKMKNYRSACIGKWHLGHLPQHLPLNHGFDYFFGLPYSNDMRPQNEHWDYARDNFPPLPLMEDSIVIEHIIDQSQLTRQYTEKAVAFIQQNRSQPFFLYLPHTFPHTPLYIDEEQRGQSKRGLYGDVVEVLDWSVGEILKTLKKTDLDQNTLVIFTSDNGPWAWRGKNGGSAGLLRGAKGSTWEGGFRVPAIAWMPGKIQANTVCSTIATTMDLFPTILAMADIDTEDFSLDGLDISATFSEHEEVQDQVFYYRNEEFVALRKGPWKIFVEDPNPWNDEFTAADLPLLFNLDQDPSEKYDVANENPDRVQALSKLAQNHVAGIVEVPSQLDSILPQYRENYDAYFAN